MKVFEWTKRLGQQHWSRPNSGVTLCGKPMLGNNYAISLAKEDKVPCDECAECVIVLAALDSFGRERAVLKEPPTVPICPDIIALVVRELC